MPEWIDVEDGHLLVCCDLLTPDGVPLLACRIAGNWFRYVRTFADDSALLTYAMRHGLRRLSIDEYHAMSVGQRIG